MRTSLEDYNNTLGNGYLANYSAEIDGLVAEMQQDIDDTFENTNFRIMSLLCDECGN